MRCVFDTNASERERFLGLLLRDAQLVEITESIRACRDPKDDQVLELAVCGRADWPSPEAFSQTPKIYSTHCWFDEQDRLWVLTNRERDQFSYLDIYMGPEYAGTVLVRHRAVGFDVLGSTLAVLVDRPVGPDDPDGFPDRGVDWYDISGLEFGVLPGE